ncbi:MAG: adenine phosphoribosyltransferase [Candidatus Doudnabacteria bacterium]
MDIKKYIHTIPDFPQKGVSFKDITPLLENARAYGYAIRELAKPFQNKGIKKVVGIDARGFLLAAGVAYKLKAGISIVRKKGKLPRQVIQQTYDLEYEKNILEMHTDTIQPGERILIVDDVLATGGTLAATIKLVKKMQGKIIGIALLIELTYLDGRRKIKGYKRHTLLKLNI